MNLVIAASVFAALALISVLAFLIRKIGFGGKDLPLTSEWINDISLDRYRPMLRMLDEGDIAFLRCQPGFTPNMAKRLRTQRTQIRAGLTNRRRARMKAESVADRLADWAADRLEDSAADSALRWATSRSTSRRLTR